jgi:hypothetical protein
MELANRYLQETFGYFAGGTVVRHGIGAKALSDPKLMEIQSKSGDSAVHVLKKTAKAVSKPVKKRALKAVKVPKKSLKSRAK